MPLKTSRGRPRLPATDSAILSAAYALLEEEGYAGFSMEAVARRAGAGKATLYRRWNSAADLLLDALAGQTASIIPLPTTGKLELDLRQLLRASFRVLNTRTAKLLRSLMAEAQVDPGFKAKFRDTFVFSRRAGVRSILEAAVNRGELPTDVDREILIDAIYGVIWYRLLIEHAPLDNKCVEQILRLVVNQRKR